MKRYRGWKIIGFGLADTVHHPPEQLRELCDETIEEIRECGMPDHPWTIRHHNCPHEGLKATSLMTATPVSSRQLREKRQQFGVEGRRVAHVRGMAAVRDDDLPARLH